MIAGLQRFLRELRGEGIAASPGEWLDALRAVDQVGLADRDRFRAALRCSLAKRRRQRDAFERVFERIFVAPSGLRRRRGKKGESPATGAGRRERREAATQRPGDRRWDGDPRSGPRELQRLLERTRQGDPRRSGRLRQVLVDPHRRGTAPGSVVHPLHRDLRRRWSLAEEQELAAWVPRLVERLRLREGRRLRASAAGSLALRRLFRENAGHGGVPFVLPRRRRRPRRPRVVLLIDVSWSVSRAAGLFLAIAGEFLLRRRRTRVLLFVDRPADATALFERGAFRPSRSAPVRRPPAPSAFRVPGLNLEAPSDYGRTFHALLGSRWRPVGRDTVLLVLGDGRTNRFDPLDWAFEEIAARCGAVLWLVPEERAGWGSGDSALARYLPHVDVAVEARDLAGLARGVAELLRRL